MSVDLIVIAIGAIIFLLFMMVIIIQMSHTPKIKSGVNKLEKAARIFIEDLESARRRVRFVCGDFRKNFFDYPGVRDSIKRAAGRGVKISAVIGSNFDPDAEKFLKGIGVEIFKKEIAINRLFRIIDDNRYYVQNLITEESKKDTPRKFIRGENSQIEAKFLIDKFEDLVQE